MSLGCLLMMAGSVSANEVTVKMNTTTKTMELRSASSGELIDVGTPESNIYKFNAKPGNYELTGFATDGKTVNGKIELVVTDSVQQQFTVLTCTAYVSNKREDGTLWQFDEDFTFKVEVSSKEGDQINTIPGNSTTAGRKTFLALNGNSYYATFTPNEEWQKKGYMEMYKIGTLTAGVNVYGAIPMGGDYSISVPSDAKLVLGLKFTHFTNFKTVEPTKVEEKNGMSIYNYRLASGLVYNYRTWMEGGLTQAGYFTMNTDKTKCPEINFTKDDYKSFNPTQINHDVTSNQGYETGDIFVNINPQGYLKLNVGESFDAHAMRTWELTDNSTNNYFMEPDFHYTVVDMNGKPSTGVIEIDNANTTTSPWSKIKAVGKGEVIVLVTYDGIGLNYYSGTTKKAYLGGEFWGAIWPENTGVYVVSVGETASTAVPNMVINEEYNQGTLKLAGKYVDAEHDVFYYLDTEAGAKYTFTPEGVANVTLAYPTIGTRTVSYNGFGSEGVTKNADGSYTLLLKEGRQIVKLTDASGNAAYQVLTAKPCSRVISNVTRPGSKVFQPGDQIKIQYSGLRHPANKLAGIYNMSAYVTYNGIPNGSSLILGSGQYTFGSAPSAQAVTINVPDTLDVKTNPEIVMDNGVIQVNGYGDPIGNHRYISPIAGRSPNFTAVPHKTYFGAIPDLKIALTPVKDFDIQIKSNVKDAKIELYFKGELIKPGESGNYSGTYGTYSIVATKAGYRCFRGEYFIGDGAADVQVFDVDLEYAPDAWDGETKKEPALLNSVYQISNGAELAWFANHVNEGGEITNAVLTKDIDLGNFEWTPIGAHKNPTAGVFSGNKYKGTFDGQMHTVSGLYINQPTYAYQALFGYVEACTISRVAVTGSVSGKQNTGGLVGSMTTNSVIDRCANHVNVTSATVWCGGIVGNMGNAATTVTNSYNTGNITGTTSCGGVVGMNNAGSVVENVYNVGVITGTTVGACVGGTPAKEKVKNAFSIYEYGINASQTLVTKEQMRSGEVAYLLGEAFGQEIGVDEYPVLGGKKVLYNADTNTYYNESPSGIEEISNNIENARWFNLQGLEVSAPKSGTRGIFIRVLNGKSEKFMF